VIPSDAKTEAILLGRYRAGSGKAWMNRPGTPMAELFDTVFRVRDFGVAALAVVAVCAVSIMGLVFALSNRLRADEFHYLANLGAPAATGRWLIAFEAAFVTWCSVFLAAALTLLLLFAVPHLLVQVAV
jgi:putative ABC transport system permease protein